MQTELEKQARIGRQAMNVQIMECEFSAVDSNGQPIGETYRKAVLYNLEKITRKEVEEILLDDRQDGDPRVVMMRPCEVDCIFPHRGESKKDDATAYWKSGGRLYCECSVCKFKVSAIDALESSINGHTEVKYRFCPNCGSRMKQGLKEEKG